MRATKVRLYIRVRRSDGKHAYVDPVWNRNRTLRAGYAKAAGALEHHPEGVYYLRLRIDGKPRWKSVGGDAELALVALRNAEHDTEARVLGRNYPKEQGIKAAAESAAPLTVTFAKEAYLKEIRVFRSAKTISSCEFILNSFVSSLKPKLIGQIERTDLLGYMAELKGRKLSDRTIFNHVARLNTFLKANDRPKVLRPSDWPTYDEKDVVAYHADELATLLETANLHERLLFQFFLQTGFREQEVAYCSWANIDFRAKTVSVWSKPEMGFRVKDKEERTVPVPDSLIADLAALKRRSTSLLLFPNTLGKPEGHFLRKLQRLAFRAGLNCGECVTKSGKECASAPVCSEWGLHKFRRTFATMHAEANVPVPTIQRWLGHADLATTQLYLAPAEIRSERTRSQVNSSFEALSRKAPLTESGATASRPLLEAKKDLAVIREVALPRYLHSSAQGNTADEAPECVLVRDSGSFRSKRTSTAQSRQQPSPRRAMHMSKLCSIHQRFCAVASKKAAARPRRESAPRPLPVDAFRKIHAYLVKHGDLTGLIALLLGYYAGLRTVEIARLIVSDVDLDSCAIKVSSGKGRCRIVPINELVTDSLRDWLAVRPANCGHDYLLCTPGGIRVTAAHVQHKLRSVAKGQGVSEFSCHRLRHAFVSRLYNAGVSPLAIMEQGGWRSIDYVARWSVTT